MIAIVSHCNCVCRFVDMKSTPSDHFQPLKYPNPEKWQDSIFHTLCFRLDIEKGIRKNDVSCNVIESKAKRRKATKVS